MRLGCRCLVHYSCLCTYIRVQLSDKLALLSSVRKQQHLQSLSSSSLPDAPPASSSTPPGLSPGGGILCPYTHAGSCGSSPSAYFMTVSDLDVLVEYGETNAAEGALTRDESRKLRRWLGQSSGGGAEEDDMEEGGEKERRDREREADDKKHVEGIMEETDTDLDTKYIEATTKPCPGCGFRASHFQ